jgi:hypothetical protein
VAEVFSLDADDVMPAPPKSKSAVVPKPVPAPPPVAAEEVFSLDADAAIPDLDAEVVAEVVPEAADEVLVLPHPAANGSAAHGTPHETVLPAKGRRPAVRITYVKPGQKSPIGK